MRQVGRVFAMLATLAACLGTAAPAHAQSFADCRDGRAEPAACRDRFVPGFQVICFNNGKKVYEGDVWLEEARDHEPLPYVQENGQEVAPLWERYGACKIIRPDAQGS